MKALLIKKDVDGNLPGGGIAITKRNIMMLQGVVGKDNLDIYDIEYDYFDNSLSRYFYSLYYCGGLRPHIIKEICKKVQPYDFVFIDSSIYGQLCESLKRQGYEGKIFTFFHNVESLFFPHVGTKAKFEKLLQWKKRRTEQLTVNFSDANIVLTERDAETIKKLYGAKCVYELPSSLEDEFCSVPDDENPENDETLNLLFVGSYFKPNIEGITWFSKEILPYLEKVKLTIVGNRMDRLKSDLENEKISVYGFVPDISSFYQEAHCVVSPIFIGGGMKTKTTEALMWGKCIVGTDEAFVGFDHMVDDNIYTCNNVKQWISTINHLKANHPAKFIQSVRDIYMKNYSLESSEIKLKEILKCNGLL